MIDHVSLKSSFSSQWDHSVSFLILILHEFVSGSPLSQNTLEYCNLPSLIFHVHTYGYLRFYVWRHMCVCALMSVYMWRRQVDVRNLPQFPSTLWSANQAQVSSSDLTAKVGLASEP